MQERRTVARRMNMHAGLKRNQCLLSMRAKSPGSFTSGLFEFCCFNCSTVEQYDVSSFYIAVYILCIILWPVSLLRAAQHILLNGLVSHSGQPKTIKNSDDNPSQLAGSHSSSKGSFVIVLL